MNLKILHLSDLHINAKTDVDELLTKIDDVGHLKPDVIVFTGDVFDGIDDLDDNEFANMQSKGLTFFEKLKNKFRIKDVARQLLFVPGNHDLNRKEVEHSSEDSEQSFGFTRYSDFLRKIYGDGWDALLGNVYFSPYYCFVKSFPEQRIILVGFSSPRHIRSKEPRTDTTTSTIILPISHTTEEPKPKYVSVALIGQGQIKRLKEAIKRIPDYETCGLVVCLHNNIFNTLEKKLGKDVDTSCLQDNDNFLDTLSQYNCRVILHGHKHNHTSRRIIVSQNVKDDIKICTVVCAGALCNSNTALNSFNYLDVGDVKDKVSVFSENENSGSFRLDEGKSFSTYQKEKPTFTIFTSREKAQKYLMEMWKKAKQDDEIWLHCVGHALFNDRTDALEILEAKAKEKVKVNVIINSLAGNIASTEEQFSQYAPSVVVKKSKEQVRLYGVSTREAILALHIGDDYQACVIRDQNHIKTIKKWFDTKFRK